MNFRIAAAAAAALGLLALPQTGDAQTGGAQTGGEMSREASARAPIGWGAQTVEYRTDGTLSLRGAVELTQGRNRFRADAMSGLRNGGDSRIEATGDVYFVTPTETIRGDRAVYTTGDGQIVVTGDVILTQGRNVATGSRLTYNVRTGQAALGGGQAGRVRGVFYPESDGG